MKILHKAEGQAEDPGRVVDGKELFQLIDYQHVKLSELEPQGRFVLFLYGGGDVFSFASETKLLFVLFDEIERVERLDLRALDKRNLRPKAQAEKVYAGDENLLHRQALRGWRELFQNRLIPVRPVQIPFEA